MCILAIDETQTTDRSEPRNDCTTLLVGARPEVSDHATLRYRVLGPLAVERDGAELDLGPPSSVRYWRFCRRTRAVRQLDRFVDRSGVIGRRAVCRRACTPTSLACGACCAKMHRLRRPFCCGGAGIASTPVRSDRRRAVHRVGTGSNAAVDQQDWPTSVESAGTRWRCGAERISRISGTRSGPGRLPHR